MMKNVIINAFNLDISYGYLDAGLGFFASRFHLFNFVGRLGP